MIMNFAIPVLVVDDTKSMSGVVVALLRKIGFTDVEEAPDAVTALQKLCDRRYGLVISDWKMEPVSGLQLLQAVRADASLAETPFIMVTSDADHKKVIAARNAGVNAYITKPFDGATLRSKIEQALAD